MRIEGKLSSNTLERIRSLIRHRISKYAKGSEDRMECEPDRREFHYKNMVEFKKFEEIDLDFSRPRNYSEIKEWIRTLYLKKKAVYVEAERKVRAILKEHPELMNIFGELPESDGSASSSK
jgi:hypothetical protein